MKFPQAESHIRRFIKSFVSETDYVSRTLDFTNLLMQLSAQKNFTESSNTVYQEHEKQQAVILHIKQRV
jgi:hypothetical protein